MIYLLKPKYNRLYVANSKEEAEEIREREGGCFVAFDHEPSLQERRKAFQDYYGN